MFAVQQGTPSTEFGIVQETVEDVQVLVVRGELDVATVPALREQLAALASERVVVDLSAVTFVDSVSLAALLTAARRADHFAVVVPRDSFGMLIFEASGMEQVLALFEARADALAHVRD